MLFFLLGSYLLMIDYSMFIEFNLLFLSSSSFLMVFYIDWMSFIFMSFVLYISSLILKYTEEYMFGEVSLDRFIILMVLFVISMMMMITSLNLLSILLGWDGLGLVSYALVIYYQNVKSFNAGMLTALSNRVGDAALLVGMVWLMGCGSLNFMFYQDLDDSWESVSISLLICGGFIMLAALTKSAQIPFSSWLPAAMAAPTPVSSLVHSSTLVTAGVYLLIRNYTLMNFWFIEMLLFISLVTMFMAGACANFEYDLKKIIALSTLSQLGMMIVILSLGGVDLAFFHLLIHALFKALLFMCAGAIIHNIGNIQDIRFMGGIIKFMPLTMICMNISNFALCGLPFLSGFYSKDLIAEILSSTVMSFFIYSFFFMSIGLTVSYSVRLILYMYWGDYNFLSTLCLSENNNNIMVKSMMGLVMFVVFMGSFFSWIMFSTPIFIILPFFMKLMVLLMVSFGTILGVCINYSMYYLNTKYLSFYNLVMFFFSMWYMPVLSTLGINLYFLTLGKLYYKSLDQGWFEAYGSGGIYYSLKSTSHKMQALSWINFKMFLLLILSYFILLLILF
uniref:NADH-ubiquinone oxidoreductase chain 5 n=1 Tax=Trypodendron domesticum TaxID=1220309 RepID=A0A343A6D9_9CUCU|nr:NADH dehydrogenase subunit 5 [Trypodendron domesticum]AOY40118.1 NADH dehydrogenase subunit 5 [Trypodendron domesticum]